MFASVPIIWFAIFDFQHTKEYFLQRPETYAIGLKNQCFNTKVFWQWFSFGAFQALVILMTTLYCLSLSSQTDGSEVGIWEAGEVVYAAVVLVVNAQMLSAFNTVERIGTSLIVLSAALFFGAYWFEAIP